MIYVTLAKESEASSNIHPAIYKVGIKCPTCNNSRTYYKYPNEFTGNTCRTTCVHCRTEFPPIFGMLSRSQGLALLNRINFYAGV